MWYRQVPWAGKSPHQVIAKVMKGKRPPIDGTFRLTKGTDRAWMRVPKLPHTLKKLIELCWHTHPASRPAAAKLFSRFADDVSPAVRKLALTPPRRGSASYSAAPASGAESSTKMVPIVVAADAGCAGGCATPPAPGSCTSPLPA